MTHVYTDKKCLRFRGIDVSVEARDSANIVHEMAHVLNTTL